ncbi:alpha-N-acetylglucosaminidase C-terminal domain-containing protein [Luteolibacter ambystomatis]|uniref:Alpha-N-acetylglucosaminidase C-terminal domain-containing protein n=1 Tax=Luteolibacter ambystomatis TaxID=2824561 RepID=A0A975G8Y6_9BACT|nr:alpha-N-acetylglucosaminidase TIM-barrel domain-containing protein [Luteolibacter ambystomatis]QUE51153.1 alpha-N-acetylglucosaminidase C-terminal domain-containing protein [Luteolibacter ambystomatis]
MRPSAFPSVLFPSLLLCLATARAELIAYEPFDYTAGTVPTANGGTGWNGAWCDATGTTAALTINAGLNAGGLGTTGGSMSIGATSTTRFRQLSSSAIAAIQQQQTNAGDVWVGYLGKNTGASGKGFMCALMTGFTDTAANRKILTGTNTFTGNAWSWTNETTVGNGNLSNIDTTNQAFYAIRFHFNSATSSTATMYLFNTSVADVTNLANATYTSSAGTNNDAAKQPVFDRLRISYQNLAIDEIRIATTFADLVSTPVVAVAPAITIPPASATATEFGSQTFTVQATGTPAPTYQWMKGGVDLPGKTSASLPLSNLTLADAGDYSVRATNSQGSATSTAATLTVLPYNRDVSGASSLVNRLLPDQGNHFTVAFIEPQDGKDVFEVESIGDKIALRGNTPVSVASALNWYLKNICLCSISRNGDQMQLPAPLPLVPAKVRIVSPHRVRFFYNPCTMGYTSAWWSWSQWEREIDLLALSGVNVAQVTPGVEEVYRRALMNGFGYSDADVRSWLCMPAHLPWMMLSNMQSFNGPVPSSLIDARATLGRQICDRMRALGIAPMVQGYYGMVPPDFKTRYPAANVLSQGGWAGGFTRPDMLNPSDAKFAAFAQAYYPALVDVYGPVRYFAADPFHEGGNTTGVDLPAAFRAIRDGINLADPRGIWVIEAWGGNPLQTILDAVDKSRLLVLDLDCSNTEIWRGRNAYNGTPWVWCAIQNFGGNTGMDAKLGILASGPAAALADASRGQMAGIGAVPEGSHTIPAAYEMLFEHAWRSDAPALVPWVRDYTRRRYGKTLPALDSAWDDLLATSQNISAIDQHPHNSIVNARPSVLTTIKARTWTTTDVSYDTFRMARAWSKLLDAADQVSGSDGFRFDLADVTRQNLCDLATRHQRMLAAAYAANDAAGVHAHGDRILEIITDLDTLCATRPEWLLGTWLRDARSWGGTTAEKDLCERDARLLVTTWGASVSDLNDYANRDWAGLLNGFYRPRWQQFLTALHSAVDNGTAFNETTARNQVAAWELNWVNGHESHPSVPTGDTIAISRSLWQKYGAEASGDFDLTTFTVGAGWTPAICKPTAAKWTRDVTSVVNQTGTWVVTFQYTSGANALQISSASLTGNGVMLDTDRHPGWTGSATYDNRYYFKVSSLDGPIILNAVANGAGGSNSSGTITLVRCDEWPVNGAWAPADCSTTRRIWTQDVSSTVNTGGTYQITMNRTGGTSALIVDRVWLEQGGQAIGSEIRDESLDATTPTQSWTLSVTNLTSNQPVTLKIATGSTTSAGSLGTIAIQKNAPTAANPTGWREWAVQQGFNPDQPQQDTDHNGVPDVLQFLQGSSSDTSLLAMPNGNHLELTAAKQRTGVTLQIEGSNDLQNWSEAADAFFTGESSLSGNRVRRSYQLDTQGSPKRFYRLRAKVAR